MAIRNEFAIHEALGPPRISAPGGIVLVKRLLISAPDDLTVREQKALSKVRDQGVDVQRIMKLRARLAPVNMEAEDRELDGWWGAIHDQVGAWTRVPSHPNYREAVSLQSSLYPEGLTFTNMKFEVQWVESNVRIERIDEESLKSRLEALIHPALLPLLEQAHWAFGEKLGVGETEVEIPDSTELIESMRDLSFLIGDYARVLSAQVDIEDEASIARFKKAIAPLIRHRKENGSTPSRPSASGSSDDDPETPIPEPPLVVDPSADPTPSE